jgi:hypothetical protein
MTSRVLWRTWRPKLDNTVPHVEAALIRARDIQASFAGLGDGARDLTGTSLSW